MNKIKVTASKKIQSDAFAALKTVSVREKILSVLLGTKHEIVIIVPKDMIDDIEVTVTKKQDA